ncbi:MAG: ABC transporter ATP-binding protein [Spirochaetota bacterium]
MSADPLFSLSRLEFSHGRRNAALDLSIPMLRVVEGERLALFGHNGSGKTTLLKLLDGLIAPTSGKVDFLGAPAAQRARGDRRVYLHQHPWLLAGTVSYNLHFGARARGMSRPAVAARTTELLALLGLKGFGPRRYRALSGGEAQRVALARALATGADILLLDEPTASADAESARLIRITLEAEARRGSTIIFSTHDPAFVRDFATRTLVLERGRITDAEAMR